MDFRRALRGLKRSPGFALGVILVLGVTTAGLLTVATAAYNLFLKPLPYKEAEQLVQPFGYSHRISARIGLSVPMLDELKRDEMLAGIAAYLNAESVTAEDGRSWRRARIDFDMTEVVGIAPRMGRGFVAEDAEPGAARVALLAERVWRSRFGADPDIVDQVLHVDGESVRIVGVMPEDFRLPSRDVELWQPLQFSADERAPENIGHFGSGLSGVVARLAPGQTRAAFQDQLGARYGDDERLRPMIEGMAMELRVESLRDVWTESYRQPLAWLTIAVMMLSLAAVLNLTGMWAARMLARDHEQAVQAALGAGPGRCMAVIGAEFVLLGMAGLLVAVALTPLGLRLLTGLDVLDAGVPIAFSVGPATVLIAVAVLLLSAAPVVAGAWWQARWLQADLNGYLASGGPSARGGPGRTRIILIVIQVALAMSLLVGVSLLLRSWHGLINENPGFEPQNLLVARISMDPAVLQSGNDYPWSPDPEVETALDHLRAVPGIDMVSHAEAVPFGRVEMITSLRVEGQDEVNTEARTRRVGKDYFRVTGTPIIQGRSFGEEDIGAENSRVIVDEWFADLHFPDGDAVGSRLYLPASAGGDALEIIGVARTVKHTSPQEDIEIGTEYRLQARPHPGIYAVVSTSVPPHTLIGPVRDGLREVLGPERVGDDSVFTMQSLIRQTVEDREPQLILLGVFAALTLLLAAIGLYALLIYSTHARTAEFGIRMALGADAGRIRNLIFSSGLRVLIPGLLFGTIGAYFTGRLLEEHLYKVEPVDPLTWLVVAGLLSVVVLVACLWPALRAARTSPIEALRHD